jgi:hypothetical protein
MADIKGNHFSLPYLAGCIGNPHNYWNAKPLANYSGMALASILLCDYTTRTTNCF